MSDSDSDFLTNPLQHHENTHPSSATSSPSGSKGRRATTEMSSPLLMVPLEKGWKREVVYRRAQNSRKKADIYYYTPKGKKLRSTREVAKHLENTGLTLENFSFKGIEIGVDDPEKEIIRDARLVRRPAAPPPPIEGRRIIKPKPPKGASPPPVNTTPAKTTQQAKIKILKAGDVFGGESGDQASSSSISSDCRSALPTIYLDSINRFSSNIEQETNSNNLDNSPNNRNKFKGPVIPPLHKPGILNGITKKQGIIASKSHYPFSSQRFNKTTVSNTKLEEHENKLTVTDPPIKPKATEPKSITSTCSLESETQTKGVPKLKNSKRNEEGDKTSKKLKKQTREKTKENSRLTVNNPKSHDRDNLLKEVEGDKQNNQIKQTTTEISPAKAQKNKKVSITTKQQPPVKINVIKPVDVKPKETAISQSDETKIKCSKKVSVSQNVATNTKNDNAKRNLPSCSKEVKGGIKQKPPVKINVIKPVDVKPKETAISQSDETKIKCSKKVSISQNVATNTKNDVKEKIDLEDEILKETLQRDNLTISIEDTIDLITEDSKDSDSEWENPLKNTVYYAGSTQEDKEKIAKKEDEILKETLRRDNLTISIEDTTDPITEDSDN